jgi:hypothetical protein
MPIIFPVNNTVAAPLKTYYFPALVSLDLIGAEVEGEALVSVDLLRGDGNVIFVDLVDADLSEGRD